MEHCGRKFILATLGIFFLGACQVGGVKSKSTQEIPPRDPPRAEVKVISSSLKAGFKSLEGRKVGAMLIYNLPDSYLIKAKHLINPPDYALKEVMDLQEERQAWFDEAIVSACDDCKNVNSFVPLRILPENLLLQLFDKGSLKQDLGQKDFAQIAPHMKEADVLWIILGYEDYEQRRGLTGDANVVSAMAENTIYLRSYIYDTKAAKILHSAQVTGTDEEILLYAKQAEKDGNELERAPMLLDRMKSRLIHLPVGDSLDALRYDSVYPYPSVPESGLIIKKALNGLTEAINP